VECTKHKNYQTQYLPQALLVQYINLLHISFVDCQALPTRKHSKPQSIIDSIQTLYNYKILTVILLANISKSINIIINRPI